MKDTYAKIIIEGSPISKSNFKLYNMNGRAILPMNSGKYHDRYGLYEEEIAFKTRMQNPGVCIEEAIIAVLKVYYKSSKRHPDTNNITKSIFDGIEKSGIIINDSQVRRLIIEEFYDKENPRFELELYGESIYKMEYNIAKRAVPDCPITYYPPPNHKGFNTLAEKNNETIKDTQSKYSCYMCGKCTPLENLLSANKGTSYICRKCFEKYFK